MSSENALEDAMLRRVPFREIFHLSLSSGTWVERDLEPNLRPGLSLIRRPKENLSLSSHGIRFHRFPMKMTAAVARWKRSNQNLGAILATRILPRPSVAPGANSGLPI